MVVLAEKGKRVPRSLSKIENQNAKKAIKPNILIDLTPFSYAVSSPYITGPILKA